MSIVIFFSLPLAPRDKNGVLLAWHWSKLWKGLLIMDKVLIQMSSPSEANTNVAWLWWTGFNPIF